MPKTHRQLNTHTHKKIYTIKKIGRESEQVFFQRQHTDGQWAHEKNLNITNHWGNVKQNHSKMSLHKCQSNCYQDKNKCW